MTSFSVDLGKVKENVACRHFNVSFPATACLPIIHKTDLCANEQFKKRKMVTTKLE